MKTRITGVAVAVVCLAIGYAIGQSQRTASAAAVDPHAAMPEHDHLAMMAAMDEHAGHVAEMAVGPGSVVQAAPSNKNLPADNDGAKQRLNTTPRHGEMTKTMVNGQPLNLWVVYPERKDKAPVVVVIHDIGGLSDWARGVGDQLAAEGFIAVVPDLITGKGPNGGGTESFAGPDDVGKAIQTLTREEIVARLNAARDYGVRLPAANGKSAVLGFCFGGSQSFMYATEQPGLNAAVVFYGSAPAAPGSPSAGPGAAPPTSYIPDPALLGKIKAPIIGFYGGADARINATIPATEAKMKELGKSYEPHIMEGAGHGFVRNQGGQNGANLKATEQAWPIAINFLKRNTGDRT